MVKRLIIVLLLIGVLFGGIFGWKHYQSERQAAMRRPPPPATVAVVEVDRRSWQQRRNAVGTLVATQGIDVTVEVAGIVREIRFESGRPVARDDTLIRLDDAVDRAELSGLTAELELARIKYRRLRRLLAERSVSQADVDEARAELDSARAAVATKQAVIEKKTVSAPFAGQLGIRQVDVGQYVAPGDAIVKLTALDPLHVDFSLPERHLPELWLNQVVEVRSAAAPGETFAGQITAINPDVDEATRTVLVRATLANPDLKLRPGMFVEAASLLPERQDVTTVPRVAVTYNPYGDAVYVVEERDGGLVAIRRQVTTGAEQSGVTEIVSGLAPGERVVVAGQVKLRSGQPVTIDNEVMPSGGQMGR